MHIDNHAFKVPSNGIARNMLAAKLVHGTYRTPGASLQKQHVRPNKKLLLSTGARSVLVAGGIGAGRVLLWHVVEEQWCGSEAEALAHPGANAASPAEGGCGEPPYDFPWSALTPE